MGSVGHLGFMQIRRVAQSCYLGNKAEFVLGPHYITNYKTNSIEKNFYKFRNVKSAILILTSNDIHVSTISIKKENHYFVL